MITLLKESSQFRWDAQQDAAFKKIKELLTQEPGPVLRYFDPSKELRLQVDASKYELGAVLLQEGKVMHLNHWLIVKSPTHRSKRSSVPSCFDANDSNMSMVDTSLWKLTDHKPLESIFFWGGGGGGATNPVHQRQEPRRRPPSSRPPPRHPSGSHPANQSGPEPPQKPLGHPQPQIWVHTPHHKTKGPNTCWMRLSHGLRPCHTLTPARRPRQTPTSKKKNKERSPCHMSMCVCIWCN